MKKLIIIPAYNEAENIVKTVTQIVEKAPDFDYVIINDCSVDNTLQICKENNFNVINLPITYMPVKKNMTWRYKLMEMDSMIQSF